MKSAPAIAKRLPQFVRCIRKSRRDTPLSSSHHPTRYFSNACEQIVELAPGC